MENKNYIFDAKNFEEGFNIWIFDKEYYNYDEVYQIVNTSLKKDGMQSPYVYLVETLNKWHKNARAQYLWIDANEQEFGKVYGYDLYNAYINTFYKDKMQDPEFSKEVYDFIKKTHPSWQFEKFVDLRKDYKDAYNPNEFKQAQRDFLEQCLLNGEFGKSVILKPLRRQWAGDKKEKEFDWER